jgi:hypothetical protein
LRRSVEPVGHFERSDGNAITAPNVLPLSMPRLAILAVPLLASVCCAAPPVALSTPPALAPLLEELVGELPGPIHYFAARVDLDDDQTPEWIEHVAGPSVCGTGGCDTLVFKESKHGLALVTRITVTRPPIIVADTETDGWRDLIVDVSGGGILPGRRARLRYDGRTYPTNPTVAPAEPLTTNERGRAVIGPFESFEEGEKLR